MFRVMLRVRFWIGFKVRYTVGFRVKLGAMLRVWFKVKNVLRFKIFMVEIWKVKNFLVFSGLKTIFYRDKEFKIKILRLSCQQKKFFTIFDVFDLSKCSRIPT